MEAAVGASVGEGVAWRGSIVDVLRWPSKMGAGKRPDLAAGDRGRRLPVLAVGGGGAPTLSHCQKRRRGVCNCIDMASWKVSVGRV